MSGAATLMVLTSLLFLPLPPKPFVKFLSTLSRCTPRVKSQWHSHAHPVCEVLLGAALSARQANKLVQSLFETLADDSTPPGMKQKRAVTCRGMNCIFVAQAKLSNCFQGHRFYCRHRSGCNMAPRSSSCKIRPRTPRRPRSRQGRGKRAQRRGG